MKPILSVFILISILTTGAWAQTSPPEISPSNCVQLAQRETSLMANRLTLGAVQADSVLQINKDYFSRIGGLRSQQLSISGRGQKLQIFENERLARLQQNLGISQYNQFIEERERIKRKIDSLRTVHHNR